MRSYRMWSAWTRISAVFVVAAVLMIGGTVAAKPPGDTRDEDVGKRLFSFNVIVKPNDWAADDDECPNNGNRIFFQEPDAGNTLGVITWLFNTDANGFDIVDCDGTEDGGATVLQDEGIPVWILVRLLGPITSELKLICDEFLEDGSGNDLCLVGDHTEYNLAHTKNFLKVGTNLVDGVNEGLTYELQILNGKPVKVLQFVVYERI